MYHIPLIMKEQLISICNQHSYLEAYSESISEAVQTNPFISIILTTCFLKAIEMTCLKSSLPSSPPMTCSILLSLCSVSGSWLCPELLGQILDLVLAGFLLCWRCWQGRWRALGDGE